MKSAVLGALTAVLFSAALAGCGDKMCPANPLPDPWKPYASLVPGETVICGSNRGTAIDHYPPTQLFVYYKKKNAPEAFLEVLDTFTKAGWTLTEQFKTDGPMVDAIHSATFTKDKATISVTVNKNDFGVQGSFVLTEKK